jgi:hypothetical protein
MPDIIHRMMRRLYILTTVAGWVSLAAIIILSLVPGSARPHTGASDFAENVVAYFGCSTLLTFRPMNWKQRLVIVSALLGCSILMEGLQNFIPGRVPDVFDVIANGFGALAGAALTTFIAICFSSI